MTRLASLHRSFPTVRLIVAPFRWIGRSRRRIWCTVVILLAIPAAPSLWWAVQLWGLPDIGDPFDVAAFRASTIPDDRNAYVLYRQAAALVKPRNQVLQQWGMNNGEIYNRWSKAAPEVRHWADENRQALALYRQGAERPDALDPVPESQQRPSDAWELFQPLQYLHVLALLEGSRLEEQGDMAGAWTWYRALLRTIRHTGTRGTFFRRYIVERWSQDLRNRVTKWAADPRTTSALLREALKDVAACESLGHSESYLLRAEYLEMGRMLDDPQGPGPLRPAGWLISLASWITIDSLTPLLNTKQMRAANKAWRFWRREPERSRRVVRLVMANWLAYYDLPPKQRPNPDPNPALNYDFYPFGPEVPAQTRILSPESLGRWLDSTHDAQIMLRMLDLNRVRLDDWVNHRELLILLGTALYRRDHGTDPPTPEALVGPYLKSLPAELPEGEDGQTTPKAGNTVE